MRKSVGCLLLAVALGAIFFRAGEVRAGITQAETGHVYNADLSVPSDGDIIFTAFIVGRESEVQTEFSAGAAYGGGWYQINVGNFPTAWNSGETLHIDFANLLDSKTGSVDILLLDHGHSTATQEACGNLNSDCLHPAIEYAPVDVTLSATACVIAVSVLGAPYGGIGFTGEKITIAVNPSNRVAAISFYLSFDASLLSIDSISLTAATQGWTLSTDSSVSGQVSADMSSPTHTALTPGSNVPALDIYVTVDRNAPSGTDSQLALANPAITSDIGTQMNSCIQGGAFHICRKGDANTDSRVDVADLIKILRMSVLADSLPADIDGWCRFDLTEDGTVNILDALRALRIALGLW